MIHLTIPVEPMGAVRMTQRSKWKDEAAQRYLAYKNKLGWYARKAISEPIDEPVSVTIALYYPIPKKWKKDKRDEANDQGIMPSVKPDIDNCMKGVFDALNKIAWTDDKLVCDVRSFKRYSYDPMIKVTIEPLGRQQSENNGSASGF